MRKIGHLFLLALLIVSACKKSTVVKEGTFTVLTYNVAGLPQGINADQFPVKNTPLISPLLNDYDVVNVQEDFNYHDLLIKDNRHPYRSKFMAPVPFGDGLNLFSNFPFTGFTRTQWNTCNGTDCLTPKGFSFCQLKIDDGVYVDLYNVHCNAGSEAADLNARRSNILQLCRYIETNSIGRAVIVMGDMNCRYTRTGDNIREVLDRGFKDVWIELARNGELPAQDGNSLMDCGSDLKHPTCEVVDKIFYRSNDNIQLTPVEFEIQEQKFTDSTGLWLSDHRPLYTLFRYKAVN